MSNNLGIITISIISEPALQFLTSKQKNIVIFLGLVRYKPFATPFIHIYTPDTHYIIIKFFFRVVLKFFSFLIVIFYYK